MPDFNHCRPHPSITMGQPTISLPMTMAADLCVCSAIGGIYFLASLGLGGNIPIDATIALEFLPQNRRFLVALLSMWQPVGVVVASAIAYGTAARYRCGSGLPACNAVADGVACCTVSSNMGWRYLVIILGAMTLTIFFLRYFVFKFHESPKFLLSRGKEQEAIDVLHKIAKFNKTAPPILTVEMFQEIDRQAAEAAGVPLHQIQGQDRGSAKNVLKMFFNSFKHLKGLFTNKLQLFIFILLAVT